MVIFLGFTHICGQTRKGRFTVHRRSHAGRQRELLQKIKGWFKRNACRAYRLVTNVVGNSKLYGDISNTTLYPATTLLCKGYDGKSIAIGSGRCGVAVNRTRFLGPG